MARSGVYAAGAVLRIRLPCVRRGWQWYEQRYPCASRVRCGLACRVVRARCTAPTARTGNAPAFNPPPVRPVRLFQSNTIPRASATTAWARGSRMHRGICKGVVGRANAAGASSSTVPEGCAKALDTSEGGGSRGPRHPISRSMREQRAARWVLGLESRPQRTHPFSRTCRYGKTTPTYWPSPGWVLETIISAGGLRAPAGACRPASVASC
jgi:hypothetical protein